MHKLTNDRARWGAWALLAGVLIGLVALFHHTLAQVLARALAQATDTSNAFDRVLSGSGVQMAAGLVLLILLNRLPEQPGRKAATYLSVGMLWLPLVGPPLMLFCMWILEMGSLLLLLLLAYLALWLLVLLLARMRHWTALLVALIGLMGALVALCGWLGILSDM
jgi:hypothetical protein